MGGFRHVAILASLLLVVIIVLSGCEKGLQLEKSYESRPIVETVEIYADEAYIVEENKITGQNCVERHYSEMNDSKFSISLGEKEWLKQPPVLGQTNYFRRVATIYNSLDEIDAIYLDKVYFYNGTETKRSKHPMMFLVEPKSSRKLYVMWDTQYDPLKDVIVDFTNNTEEAGFETRIFRLCYNETETVNVTKTRKVLTGTEEKVVGYDDYVKVKLERKS